MSSRTRKILGMLSEASSSTKKQDLPNEITAQKESEITFDQCEDRNKLQIPNSENNNYLPLLSHKQPELQDVADTQKQHDNEQYGYDRLQQDCQFDEVPNRLDYSQTELEENSTGRNEIVIPAEPPDGNTNETQGIDFDSDDSLHDPDYQKPVEGVVEESEEGLEEENEEYVVEENEQEQQRTMRGRKRRRHEDTWKVNMKKKKVATGQEHVSKTKTIKAKKVGPPCEPTCPLRCFQKLSLECRLTIHNMFYQPDKDIDKKRQFVASHVEIVPVERIRPKTGKREGARSHTRLYYFELDETRTRVCATMFLNTLAISPTFVTTALKKKIPNAGGIIETDARGKHGKHAKIPDFVKQNVRDHITKFPAEESHYSRERSNRKFLGSHLNLSKMYSLYKSECEENNLTESLIAKDWLYFEIFNTEFNLSFKPPDNDTCDQCDYFLVSLRDVQNDVEKNRINGEYQDHLAEASKRYSLKKKDREDASENSRKNLVLCVDLQKCLPTPVLTNSQSFYSLKLWTYNYTLYDATNKKVTCVMWDESKAGRGGNEMASGMLKWALANIKPEQENIIIWSDNCPSQNRNIIMVMAYFWILSIFPTIKTINHKFLLRGHTHLEVDACHSLIERERKKAAGFQIMSPWDWQQLARMCSVNNPFQVINMGTEDFKDFKKLYTGVSSPFIFRKKNEIGEDVSISKMVHLQVRAGASNKGILYYKYEFDSDFKDVNLNRTGRRVAFPHDIPPIRVGLNPLSMKKFSHLQNLLKWVPKEFHDYYKNLAHHNTAAVVEDEEED